MLCKSIWRALFWFSISRDFYENPRNVKGTRLLKYLCGNALLPSSDCKRTPCIPNWLLKSQSQVSSDLMHLFAEHLWKHLYNLAMTRLIVQFWYYYKYVLKTLWQNFVCYPEFEFWQRDSTKLTCSVSLHGSRVCFLLSLSGMKL